MMIGPESFIDRLKDKPYKKLLKERDRLLKDIEKFETGKIPKNEQFMKPSPATRYQMNLLYLGELCKLISEKYKEEYIYKR